MILAALAAFAVAVLRSILFYSGNPAESKTFLLLHVIVVVTVVFFVNNRAMARHADTSFPALMRDGFKAAALYALCIGVFTWIYHAAIDHDTIKGIIENAVADGMRTGATEIAVRSRVEALFTPFNNASITFFGLLLAGAALALLIAVAHHKVLRRFRR